MYSEISIHFCKGCRIFHEGVKEAIIDAINRNNMAFSHNIAIGPAFGQYMAFAQAIGHNMTFGPAFGPAFGHSKRIKLIGPIGLGVSFISLGISFIGGFACCVDLSLIDLGGHNGDISLIGLRSVSSARRLIDFIGLGIEGLISKYGFIGLGLLGFIGLGLGSLINGIGLIGLGGHNSIISLDLISLIGTSGFGLVGLVGLISVIGFGLISHVGLSGFGFIGLSSINGLIVKIGLIGFVDLSGFSLASLAGISGFSLISIVGLSGINGLIG
jgi:hypothetical protein